MESSIAHFVEFPLVFAFLLFLEGRLDTRL